MKIRFQADADLNQMIVRAVLRREPIIDFQTAHVANLFSLSDNEVLVAAARAGRVLVTHDRKTMPTHFGGFIATQTSPGVIVIPQSLAIHQAADELILIWTATEAEEWTNRIYSLPI